MDLTKSKQQAGNASNNLNLNVLQRKDPSIARIVETATHVVAYRYNHALQSWERKDVEGSLFVFERTATPRYGFFVMNRISIENIMELVTPDMKFKISEPYLLYRNPLGEIVGIWFYNESERRRVAGFLAEVSEGGPETRPQEQQPVNLLSMLQAAAQPDLKSLHYSSTPHRAYQHLNGTNGQSPHLGPTSPLFSQHTPARYPALTQQQVRPTAPLQSGDAASASGYNVEATSDLLRMLNRATEESKAPLEQDLQSHLRSLLLSGPNCPAATIAAVQKDRMAEEAASKAKASVAFKDASMIPTQARIRKKQTSTSDTQLMSRDQLRDALVQMIKTDDDLLGALYAEYIVQMNRDA